MTDHRKIAEDFARHLKAKYGDRIARIILFGSVARGNYRKDSDIDLLVVTPDTSWGFRLQLAAAATDVLLRDGVYVSVKPVAPGELDGLSATLFGRAIRKEGLVLA